ncbi:M1 family metallopeptidase [Mesonia sp. HuA40]|uniref:M1 family metallopeptidase n=1 Tax=Mesonia sp. HuA40 TaxID=2602761 RepID=UPI0011C8A1E8|nr:M1 family metallopeptidase [Mesonia sp. HuA40]TXK74226.1 M1 family metallopeptidase [Mesonia sp. HuA40]
MRLFSILCFILLGFSMQAQLLDSKPSNFTRADSLRGSLRPERSHFDVLKYNLDISLDIKNKSIRGFNEITAKVLYEQRFMQLDLFKNMQIDSVIYQGRTLAYEREGNAFFIDFEKKLPAKKQIVFSVYYSGKPKVAVNAPWDGGFIFSKDKNGNPWVSVAVQGTGASLWYPNKDHLSDEPESARIHVSVPNGLMNVSNGRLLGKKAISPDLTRWSWEVKNPINNYNIILNVGDYTLIKDEHKGLDLHYYVLSYNEDKARQHFKEVKPMMDCFYEKFGAYPFIEDSYKLVETPYLGMEHQSAVAYGNQFNNGYLGRDLSGTGVGLKWDFITIHESAHEWFGNSISASDIADLWIHEAFTTYAESIYVECRWGKEDALKYLYGIRANIKNQSPIIGTYGVNHEGSADMYYKGANMLNTLRSIIGDDKEWWTLLKAFSLNFKHQVTNTQEVVDFFEVHTSVEVSPIFLQYLNYPDLPELQIKEKQGKLFGRWVADVPNFSMPIRLGNQQKNKVFDLNTQWQTIDFDLSLDEIGYPRAEYYIRFKRIKK